MREQSLELPEKLAAAIRLSRDAGKAILEIARAGFTHERKEDRSFVTSADLESDDILRSGLSSAFPQDGILSEESGGEGLLDSEFIWVLDPLDGTRAFVKQVPGFSVMVGLLHHGTPVLGVVYDPIDDWLYYATSGSGAHAVPPGEEQPKELRVSRRARFPEMPLISSPGLSENLRQFLCEEVGLVPGRQINSVGVKVGLLLRQEGDVYFNYHGVSYWDTVAPLLIAAEGGATSTLLDGQPFTYDLAEGSMRHIGPSLITNGQRHEELRDMLLQKMED